MWSLRTEAAVLFVSSDPGTVAEYEQVPRDRISTTDGFLATTGTNKPAAHNDHHDCQVGKSYLNIMP